jgi:hypothetical protein
VNSTNSNPLVDAIVYEAASSEIPSKEKSVLIQSVAMDKTLTRTEIGREIPREFLVNRLNLINFQEDVIRFNFVDIRVDQSILLLAFPFPCAGLELDCKWIESTHPPLQPMNFALKYILVPWGGKFILFIPEVVELNLEGCALRLPDKAYEFSRRRVERQYCRAISVCLNQDGNSLSGTLVDFSAASFRVEFFFKDGRPTDSFDVNHPVMVCFYAYHQVLFTGECRVIRTKTSGHSLSYVLETIHSNVPHFRKADFRSERQVLRPSPSITICHPLTQKRLSMKAVDLSGSGFSVEEDERSACLLPGLILPEVVVDFAGIFKMSCSAKVVFRKPVRVIDGIVYFRCGATFISVKARDHVKLLGVLDQSQNENAYLGNDVNLEALWDFLFETGFIYPKKYAHIAKKKNEIKKTYTNLYINSPDIARHFIYQDNGRILGHMSALRFWENAWLIHHHAARKSAQKKAGLAVLKQFGRFGHNTFRLPGMCMDYLVCYFRPQNRFPNRIFGGVARHINDPKGCSLDLFAYLNLSTSGDAIRGLPQGWELSPANASDMIDLVSFYEKQSGGLMLKAFNLCSSAWRKEKICAEFRRHGLKRERYLFALRKDRAPVAILLVEISDLGLNLSNLTHCINALIIDPENLPPEVLLASLHRAETATGQSDLSALIFPLSYVQDNAIVYEKEYCLWVFHMRSQSQIYFKYMNRLMKYV